MRLIIISLIIFILPLQAFAGSITQTSWSKGPDYYHTCPCFELGITPSPSDNSSFWVSNAIDWFNSEGSIELGYGEEEIFSYAGFGLSEVLQYTVVCIDKDNDDDIDVINVKEWATPSSFSWLYTYTNSVSPSGVAYWGWGPCDMFIGPANWFISHADINNDGYEDLVAHIEGVTTNAQIIWLANCHPSSIWDENVIDEHEIEISSGLDPFAIRADDIDMDGDVDIITPYMFADGQCPIRWYENINSGNQWQFHTISENTDNPWCIHSADYDNDGDVDILITFLEAEQIRLYENTGSGDAWIEHLICEALYPSSAMFADIDGIGTKEILACDVLEDEVYWLMFETGDIWVKYLIDDSFDGAWRIRAEDMDCDGDIDVVGLSRFSHVLVWWENLDGTGLQWAQHKIGFCNYGTGLDIADVNKDNFPDIIYSSNYNEIKWFDISQKAISGNLESSFLDTESDLNSFSINWTAETPPGTSIYFQIRSSDDMLDYIFCEEWSERIYEQGYIGSLERFVQYKVTLASDNPGITPVLHDVTLNWTELGIELGEHSQSDFGLFPVSPNPARGCAEIRFTVPGELHVSINVFDISGRLVSTPVDGVFPEGEHSISVEGLSTGIYFYRMVSSGFSDIKRMIVLEQEMLCAL